MEDVMRKRKQIFDDTTCRHILIFTIVAGMAVATLCAVENLYYRDGIVTEINGDTVTVKDFSGNDWDFVGTGYVVNEPVRLLMNTQGTDDIYDDEIVQAFPQITLLNN